MKKKHEKLKIIKLSTSKNRLLSKALTTLAKYPTEVTLSFSSIFSVKNPNKCPINSKFFSIIISPLYFSSSLLSSFKDFSGEAGCFSYGFVIPSELSMFSAFSVELSEFSSFGFLSDEEFSL